jgi:hypothetical protein
MLLAHEGNSESLKIAKIPPELRRRICVNVAAIEINFLNKVASRTFSMQVEG